MFDNIDCDLQFKYKGFVYFFIIFQVGKFFPAVFNLSLKYSTLLTMYDDNVYVSRIIRDCIIYIEYHGKFKK